MKRCSQCGVPNGLPELFCGACGQVLAESTYLRAIAICSALSVATHGVLRLVGVYTRFSVAELFVLATFFPERGRRGLRRGAHHRVDAGVGLLRSPHRAHLPRPVLTS